MVYGASDLPVLFAESGVPVTVGATTDSRGGLLDSVDEEMLRGEMAHLAGRVSSVLVRSGQFNLTRGGAITVEGVAYKIHAFAQIDDGALTRITLAKVT